MLRIAHVLSTPSGLAGAELLVAALARRSHAAGDSVVVLNVFQSADMGDALVEACRPVPVRSAGATGARDLPRLRRWLAQELDDEEPDVVHVHLARALVLTATLPRRRGRHLLLTHHHGELFAQQGRRAARLAERAAVRRYDRVVAVSPAVAQAVADDLGYPVARIRVIVNGWDGTPLPRRPAHPPRIVCVARLRKEKGQEVLLRAFPAVCRRVPGVELHLLGDGPQRVELERLAGTLSGGDGIVFHGAVSDVWPHLAAASAVAQPSLVEPFGIAALEALAAGAPLVASRTGGLPHFVEHGDSGLLVEPGDVDGLARSLGDVLTQPDLAARLSDRAPVRAADFRLERTLDEYARLYEELASSATGGEGS